MNDEMIKQPTVLILGAGASQPYGFLLGAGLVDQICAEIIDNVNSPMMARLEQLGYPRDRAGRWGA